MALVTRARIVANAAAKRIAVPTAPTPAAFTRIENAELVAREIATRLVADAKRDASAIIEDARTRAANVAEIAAREAAEAEQARLAAQFLALAARQERTAETELDRAVDLARVLAERLLGEAVRAEPAAIAKLARQSLAEAQGARTVRIEAHPDDVAALREHAALLQIAQVTSITADASLERGSLRLHTDLGTIDAQLRPQLERLAAALRDALR